MRSSQVRQTLKFFLLMILSGLSANAAELVLRSTCACDAAYVTLHDVADIKQCDAEIAEQLGSVQLLPTPGAGRTRILRVREIQELLELNGIEVDDHKFRGASRVEVRGSANPKPVSANSKNARSSEPSREVVVARKPMTRGEIIRAEDVELKKVYSPVSERERLLDRIEDVVGKQTTRSLTTGQMLDAGWLQRPMVVHRAGTVTVYVRVGGIQVATKARSLNDGALDDVVTVELLEDRQKRLAGRVIGLDEVEVFAQGATIDPVAMRKLPSTQPKNTRPSTSDDVPQITRKN